MSDELPPLTAAERARALRDRGTSAEDAALLATLVTGGTPASVLLADALEASELDADGVAQRVADELGVSAVAGATPRIKRYLDELREGRENRVARCSPRAVEAIAAVLGASRDAFVRSFEAAAAAVQPGGAGGGVVAGALAREGRDDVHLDAARAAEDDDEIDALFNRPLG